MSLLRDVLVDGTVTVIDTMPSIGNGFGLADVHGGVTINWVIEFNF